MKLARKPYRQIGPSKQPFKRSDQIDVAKKNKFFRFLKNQTIPMVQITGPEPVPWVAERQGRLSHEFRPYPGVRRLTNGRKSEVFGI